MTRESQPSRLIIDLIHTRCRDAGWASLSDPGRSVASVSIVVRRKFLRPSKYSPVGLIPHDGPQRPRHPVGPSRYKASARLGPRPRWPRRDWPATSPLRPPTACERLDALFRGTVPPAANRWCSATASWATRDVDHHTANPDDRSFIFKPLQAVRMILCSLRCDIQRDRLVFCIGLQAALTDTTQQRSVQPGRRFWTGSVFGCWPVRNIPI